MAIPVEMPKMSDTMEEGVLVSWLAEEGDEVSAGDVIAQVETDKATMDLEVYDDGFLLKKVIGEGEAVPIGGLIAVLGDKDEDVSELVASYRSNGKAGDGEEAETAQREDTAGERSSAKEQVEAAQAVDEDGRVKSSPLARKLAKEHGLRLADIEGSGPEGRVVKRDVEALIGEEARPAERRAVAPAAPAASRAPAYQTPAQTLEVPTEELYQATPISQMRKTIARRLAQSKFTAPHFYLTVDVAMERAVAFRERLNVLAEQQGRPKVSFNDVITKVCAVALRQHPQVNASYLEQQGEIRHYRPVHVAVAVAVDEGLLTPVIRDADRKGVGQIAAETRTLAEKARNRELQPEDWEGSTFTTSNLGMFGIEEFTAIINPPNACILAVGAIRDVPVVKDGAVVPGKRMKLTLSCDHRVVDGATGARFLETVKTFLEDPLAMML